MTTATAKRKTRKKAAGRRAPAGGAVDPVRARLRRLADHWPQAELRTWERTPAADYDATIRNWNADDDGNIRIGFRVQGKDPETGRPKEYSPARWFNLGRDGQAGQIAASEFKTEMARTGQEPPPEDAHPDDVIDQVIEWLEWLANQTVRIRVEHEPDRNGRIDPDTRQVRTYERVRILRVVTD